MSGQSCSVVMRGWGRWQQVMGGVVWPVHCTLDRGGGKTPQLQDQKVLRGVEAFMCDTVYVYSRISLI